MYLRKSGRTFDLERTLLQTRGQNSGEDSGEDSIALGQRTRLFLSLARLLSLAFYTAYALLSRPGATPMTNRLAITMVAARK